MKKFYTLMLSVFCFIFMQSLVFADVAAGPMYLLIGAVYIIPAILVIAIIVLVASFLYKYIKYNKKDK